MAVYLGSNQVGVTIGASAQKEEGSSSVQDVNFYDYDGTLIKSYTAEDWQSNGALPANPSHEGLVAQGWNWTKAQIDSQLTNVGGVVNVGQMYITESRDTEIDVEMHKGRLSPTMTIAVKGTITIDWGDNTTPDTVTGTSLTAQKSPTHTYSSAGSYTIKIHASSGSFAFSMGSTSYQILRKNTVYNQNKVYSNCIRKVRIGTGITTIDNYAFNNCFSLVSITIPNTITSIGDRAFYDCYSLASITIPNTVTSIGSYAFQYCGSLASITIPNTIPSIGSYAFQYCYSLASITIPNTVTSIGSYAFQYCYCLASITIPNTVTSISSNVFNGCSALTNVTIPNTVISIGERAFYACSTLTNITIPNTVTNISSNVFYGCHCLASITIPNTVTSIGNNVFYNCYGMAEYHIKPTTVPTLGTSAFGGILSDCKIYVPAASLSDYQAATNWSTYASYMVGE